MVMNGQRLVALGVALTLLVGGCGDSKGASGKGSSGGIAAEPRAGEGKLWVLQSADQVTVPPPPEAGSPQAKAEAAEVAELAAKRTPEVEVEVHRWSDYPAIEPMIRLNMELVSEQSKNPPLASRGYGLVSAAMNDAVVAAYHWKYEYRRDPPPGSPVVPAGADPSYPNEHAAMAGAATRLLGYLFPERTQASYDATADAVADSRVAGGMNFRSDVEAGLALGRAVADEVIAFAKTDGSDHHWDGKRPEGTGSWQAPPGVAADKTQPVEPLAGTWRTWIVKPESVRPGPPPAYGSEPFLAEAKEVLEVGRNLTEDQTRIAKFWAAGAGTPLPPGMWNQIALDKVRAAPMSIPRMARIFSFLNVAESDAGVAAWDCKFAFWSPRPINAIRDLGLDPAWKPLLTTPVFPSYISGHSAYSAAAAEVLSKFFPEAAAEFHRQAEEAAVSRLYGGIHYRSDNVVGLEVGKKVGRAVVDVIGTA
jgi:membrane-associated phospholipid phosphatase